MADSREVARRRRVLAEIFGDVLPEVTSDEPRPASGESDRVEQWYRENRPPHHGDTT